MLTETLQYIVINVVESESISEAARQSLNFNNKKHWGFCKSKNTFGGGGSEI